MKKLIETQLDLFQRPDDTLNSSRAEFSPDRKHRYALWRTWNKEGDVVMFIALNPSTADEVQNDPTVTRCIKYAERWGYGGMIMSNIFAYRATDPNNMKAFPDPVGPENDTWLLKLTEEARQIIIAWGNHGSFLDRGRAILELLKGKNLHFLELNDSGAPKHPLYCSGAITPTRLPLAGPIEIKNLRLHKNKAFKDFDAKIDRSSILGNPFPMQSESEREMVCWQYEEWFRKAVLEQNNPAAVKEFNRLVDLYATYGRLRLFCWCFPKQCHGETIRENILKTVENRDKG